MPTSRRGGFRRRRVSWDSTKAVTIALDGRVGRIEGRLVAPDGKDLASKLALSIRRNPAGRRAAGRRVIVRYFKTVSIQGDGRFRFNELPPGHYAIHLDPTRIPVTTPTRSRTSRSAPVRRSPA